MKLLLLLLTTVALNASHLRSTHGILERKDLNSAATCSFTNEELWFSPEEPAKYVKPSEFVACMKKVPVNAAHFSSYVTSLRAIFQNWFVFYDVAANPEATEPNGVGPHDLGYSIYHGRDHGQIDLEARMKALAKTSTPMISDFWELQKTFSLLRDNHVHLPGEDDPTKATPKLGTIGSLSLAPFIYLKIKLSPFPSYEYKVHFRMLNDNPDQVEMQIENIDRKTVDTVKSFHGMPPKQLLLFLANFEGSEYGNYKATGARVNKIVNQWKNQHHFSISGGFDPSDLFPDKFTVEYESRSELWRALASIQPDPEKVKNDVGLMIAKNQPVPVSVFAGYADQPGSFYTTIHEYALDLKKEHDYVSELIDIAQQLQQIESKNRGSKGDKVNADRVHTDAGPNDAAQRKFQTAKDEGGAFVGYYIGETYAVFKLLKFELGDTKVIPMWQEMVGHAEKKGIKHLIVDITSNLGGAISLGYELITCMFPGVGLKHLENVYNARYTDGMEYYAQSVKPFLEKIGALPEKTRAGLLANLSHEQVQHIAGMVTAMYKLAWFDYGQPCDNRALVDFVKLAAKWAKTPHDVKLAHEVFQHMLLVVERFNPWTALPFLLEHGVEIGSDPVVARKRGNKEGIKFTQPFNMINKPIHDAFKAQCPPTPFTSYVMLGNGEGGSTANLFETTCTGLASTGVLSESSPNYTSVSYGGTGQADTPLTQVAGGTIGAPRLAYSYVAEVGMMAVSLGLVGTEYEAEASKLAREFDAAIPDLPFYANAMPDMPVFEEMSKALGGLESMPMEYVRTPPLNYIPQFYYNKFDPNGEGGVTKDAWELYEVASKFFSTDDD